MTYRELSYMILDQLKLSTDDSYFDVPHVVWLINKYRSLLIKRNYDELRKEIPDHVYQNICLELELSHDCVKGTELKSKYEVPKLIHVNMGHIKITPAYDFFQSMEWTYISPERMSFVGNNKYLKNIIYFTIYNRHLYIWSFKSGYEYLKNVMMRVVLEDPSDTFKDEYRCGDLQDEECLNILDVIVPIEESLVPALMEMVLKDLTPSVYKPEDIENNAQDDFNKVGLKNE